MGTDSSAGEPVERPDLRKTEEALFDRIEIRSLSITGLFILALFYTLYFAQAFFLPIVLAGGASGRRPLRIIVGLVGSFTLFTLGAAWLLDRLGLPEDLLRNLAIGLLFLVALTAAAPAGPEITSYAAAMIA